jgi:glycosyltransferase involved in cell wall biosynthesis
MISVVIPTLNDEAMLGRALQPLVNAAVSGLVREVIVADGGSTDATLDVADEAGCLILAGQPPLAERLRAAAGRARGDWLMVLRPCVQLLPGWEALARQHLETRSDQGACFPAADPTRDGPFAWLAEVLGAAARPDALLAPRQAFVASGRPRSLRRLGGCALLIRPAAR